MPKPSGFLGYNALLGDGSHVENSPSKTERIKQALWDSNLNTPFRSFYNLMHTPLEVLLGAGSQEQQETTAGNALGTVGAVVAGTSFPLFSKGFRGVSANENLVSKSPLMYDPPHVPPRDLAADYPHGAPIDERGQITHDIEGRPLTARWIVGRSRVDDVRGMGGGQSQAFPSEELVSLAKATTSEGSSLVAPRSLGQDVGRTVIDAKTGKPVAVYVANNLPAKETGQVLAHEIGHAINAHAGKIPASGLLAELKPLYNTLNNPNRSRDGSAAAAWGKPFTPTALGYSKSEKPLEYMAEAFRAYLTNPDYIKTAAPKTAARIRKYVNDHPELSKIIQFNSIAALGSSLPDQQQEPSR